MKPYRFEVTEEQMASLSPEVRESMLRLWVESLDRPEPEPDVWQGRPLTVKSKQTYDDSRKRFEELVGRDGSVDMTHLFNPKQGESK